MNSKLILRLSLFGLAMAIATVYVIPANVEPFVWFVIFIDCAYFIATRAGGRYFLHGLLVGVCNSVWITSIHVMLFEQYMASHPEQAQMMTSMPLADSPRLMMAVTGPIIGVVSGAVLGLFAVAGRWLLGSRNVPASPAS